MSKKLSFFSLAILIIAAIDSIRNLPSAALFGSSLIFFFALAALIFLFPTSMISAELSSMFPDKGGIYHWLFKAFGEKTAMTGIWLQWINTMVWYPSFLSFIAGTFAYLIDPALAENKGYLALFIVILFWTMTIINLQGIHVSAKINNVCAFIGTIVPMIALITLGGFWVFQGKPLQIELSPSTLIPSLSEPQHWVSLVAIMASFLGIELAGVHINDIAKPHQNFPKAILIAACFILVSMVGGSLAIAVVVPDSEISLISGVPHVLEEILKTFGFLPAFPILTACIALGAVGSMINWLISPAKGLLHAAEFGFLPPFFTKTNRAGVAQNILLAQAIIVSSLCLLFLFFPTINQLYWFLTALSTELYMFMYLLMFAAGLRLHYRYKNRAPSFKIPGKGIGMWASCLLGFIGCTITIIVSFLPPEEIQVKSVALYMAQIGLGNVLALTPLLLFFMYQKKTS